MLPPKASCLAVAVFCLVALTGAAQDFPDVPALPDSGWPAVPVAERFARHLVAQVSPSRLAATLEARPDDVPPILRHAGSALMTDDLALRATLEQYLREVAAAEAVRITSDAPGRLRLLVAILLVDPYRFVNDAAFRDRVARLLPRALDERTAPAVRRAALAGLNDAAPLDFATFEATGAAWGCLPRRSAARRTGPPASLRMPDDLRGPIEASFYSLSSQFFTPHEARTFLTAVRAAAPGRRIVVLADAGIADALRDLKVDLVETFSRPFTPWPRDPFLIARSGSSVVFVNRPNAQPEREEDANMVQALVSGLPTELDALWKPRWSVAATPFHNGQVLLTPAAAWISIHTVELRALELLGLTRVPVESFDQTAGIRRYLAAVQKAAKELEPLYGRPVRFVHSLQASPERMQHLGGGAGYDLDSLLTLLPRPDGSLQALVGDVHLGAKAVGSAPLHELEAVRDLYAFEGDAATLGRRLAEAQATDAAVSLQGFLDAVATSLTARGVRVRRLPLLRVPSSMVAHGEGQSFLLTWNNVVLERQATVSRAEGFASLLSSVDSQVTATFAEAGYGLRLFPPLARSVILNGGYRCASNHLRP